MTEFPAINDASAFVKMFLSPMPVDRSCAAGEKRRSDIPALKATLNATNDDCIPVSCKSARACATDVVCVARSKSAAATNGGIGFTCGCDKGYAQDLHLNQCIAVNCSAPDACTPLAKCVNFAVDELDEYCNPTPTMAEQWRRGPKPCPRFRCLPK